MWETDHRVPEETQASAAGQDDAVTRQSRFRSKRPQLTRSSFFYGTFLNERWQEIASLDHGDPYDMSAEAYSHASPRASTNQRVVALETHGIDAQIDDADTDAAAGEQTRRYVRIDQGVKIVQ